MRRVGAAQTRVNPMHWGGTASSAPRMKCRGCDQGRATALQVDAWALPTASNPGTSGGRRRTRNMLAPVPFRRRSRSNRKSMQQSFTASTQAPAAPFDGVRKYIGLRASIAIGIGRRQGSIDARRKAPLSEGAASPPTCASIAPPPRGWRRTCGHLRSGARGNGRSSSPGVAYRRSWRPAAPAAGLGGCMPSASEPRRRAEPPRTDLFLHRGVAAGGRVEIVGDRSPLPAADGVVPIHVVGHVTAGVAAHRGRIGDL